MPLTKHRRKYGRYWSRLHKSEGDADRGPGQHLYAFKYADWECEKCGSIQELTRDHIIPKARGGRNIRCNIQILCVECNTEKGEDVALYTTRPEAVRYVTPRMGT